MPINSILPKCSASGTLKTIPRNTWHLHVFMDTSCFCFLLFYASQEVPVTYRARRLGRCPNHTWDGGLWRAVEPGCHVIVTSRDSLRWRATATSSILAESGQSKPIPTCWEMLPIRFFGKCEANFACVCKRNVCLSACLLPLRTNLDVDLKTWMPSYIYCKYILYVWCILHISEN